MLLVLLLLLLLLPLRESLEGVGPMDMWYSKHAHAGDPCRRLGTHAEPRLGNAWPAWQDFALRDPAGALWPCFRRVNLRARRAAGWTQPCFHSVPILEHGQRLVRHPHPGPATPHGLPGEDRSQDALRSRSIRRCAPGPARPGARAAKNCNHRASGGSCASGLAIQRIARQLAANAIAGHWIISRAVRTKAAQTTGEAEQRPPQAPLPRYPHHRGTPGPL